MGGRGDLLYYFQFSATIAGEESALDGAQQAALPGSGAHRCWTGLARGGGCGKSFVRLTFLEDWGHSFPSSIPDFKRSSRRSWSVTFRCLLVCVSMPVVCMSPRESIDDADCELFRL